MKISEIETKHTHTHTHTHTQINKELAIWKDKIDKPLAGLTGGAGGWAKGRGGEDICI